MHTSTIKVKYEPTFNERLQTQIEFIVGHTVNGFQHQQGRHKPQNSKPHDDVVVRLDNGESKVTNTPGRPALYIHLWSQMNQDMSYMDILVGEQNLLLELWIFAITRIVAIKIRISFKSSRSNLYIVYVITMYFNDACVNNS